MCVCGRGWGRMPGLTNDAVFLASTWISSSGHGRLYLLLYPHMLLLCDTLTSCSNFHRGDPEQGYSSSPVLQSITTATKDIFFFTHLVSSLASKNITFLFACFIGFSTSLPRKITQLVPEGQGWRQSEGQAPKHSVSFCTLTTDLPKEGVCTPSPSE